MGTVSPAALLSFLMREIQGWFRADPGSVCVCGMEGRSRGEEGREHALPRSLLAWTKLSAAQPAHILGFILEK